MNYKIDASVSFGARVVVAANSKAPARSGVRKAVEADIGEIMALLAVMLKESTYRAIPLHEDKLRAFLRFTSTDKNHACLVYQARDGRIDGVILGFVTEHWFSLEKGVWDLALFVRPERRGGIAAGRLWSAFKTWAQAAGAKTLCLGTVAGIAPERTRRFYTGLGMTEVGSLFLLDLQHAR
jgi:GNAT superfamily N-acetyltransferase